MVRIQIICILHAFFNCFCNCNNYGTIDKSINEKDPLASDTKEIPSALNGAEKIDNPLNKEENKDEEKAAEDAKKHVGQEDAKKVVSAEEATPEKKKGIFEKKAK